MATTSSTSAAPPYTSFCSSSSSSFTPLSKHVDWLEPAVPADPVPADPTFTRASQVPSHLHDPHHDSKRPIYHPQSAKGWSSDPCGPIFYKGRYHLFYQHLRSSCQWYWGLCWDHLVSDDLVHWKNLPPAIIPTPGWYDADGCFSGTVEFDPELGVPVIMYTGVYLKANKEAVAAHGLPPPGHDPGTRFVERQLAAVPADPEDPDLTVWRKLPEPVMYPAPKGVSCWRDPFCVQRPAAAGGSGDEWVVGLASGIKGVGGAVLRFTSKHFTHGWTFDGYLADGDNQALGLRGNDWECPILSRLPRVDAPPALASLPARKAGGGEAAGKQQLLEQAAAAAAASLGPSVSQQLPPLSKHKRGAGSMSSCASTGSLLGVWHYPAGCAMGCDSETISSSISDCSRVSEVSSGASYGATQQGYAQHAPSSLVASSSSVALDRVVSAAPTMVSATNSSSSTAVTCGSHVEACGTAAGGAADGAVAPLTEPVLAAATEAAAAAAAAAAVACDGALTQQHPSTNLYAWLEQAPEPAQAAVAAAAAVVGAGDVAGLALTNSASTRTSTDPVAVLGGSPADMLQLAPAAATTGSITDSSCSSKDWFFCISPEACNFPITWWVGSYDGHRFDVAVADGPHRLDLGTTLYAATMWQDPQGRQLLFGWMQEHRRVPTPPALCEDFFYAGCIGTPRVLQLVGDRLYQTPLPEVDVLRTQVSWHAEDVALSPDGPLLPLQVVSGTHLDINVTFQPPAQLPAPATPFTSAAGPADAAGSSARAGLAFKSWKACGRGAAVLSFDWSTAALTVDFDEPLPDAYTPHPEDTPERKRIGGPLRNYEPGTPLSLRVLLDGSALEVFTSTGETLTTRVYRGHPPSTSRDSQAAATTGGSSSSGSTGVWAGADDETGICLFAAGAAVRVSRVDVWEMGCSMVELEDATWLDEQVCVHPQHQADDADLDRVLRQAARSTGSSSVPVVLPAELAAPPAGAL